MIYADSKPFRVYGKVWKITKTDKYLDLQMSTSEKGQDGEYINSGWFPRCIGHAFNALKDKLKEGDRIVVTKAKFTNERYTDNEGKTKSHFRFLILEASIEDGNSKQNTTPQSQEQHTAATPAPQTEGASDDDCPW